jgi:PAS domain S-box-containing protein
MPTTKPSVTLRDVGPEKGGHPAAEPTLGGIGPVGAADRGDEARYRAIFDTAVDAIAVIDETGCVQSLNPAAERLFGYAAAELVGRNVSLLMPEPDRTRHDGYLAGYLRTGQAKIIGIGREVQGRRKDGSSFPLDLSIAEWHSGGQRYFTGIMHDVTGRKQLEELFRRVVEWAPNAMVMINDRGTIEMVNVQVERVFGYARSELLGQAVEMLVPERFRRNHPGLRGSFFSDPQSRPMGAGRDLFGLKKDGSEVPIEIGLNPIETGAGTMVLSAIVDITERKAREASIQAALREKDVLLGEIHHRVKNNLQIIHSLLDLQSGNIADPALLGLMRESQNRIRSMALIHQTLYQSKDFARVDFRVFLDSLVPTLISSYGVGSDRVALRMNAIDVLLPIDAAIPCGLVVNELISNALKHAFPGERTGEIRIDLEPQADDWVVLSVSDDGIGIPESLDLTQTTTLGLQLVTLLADQLGGELAIQRAAPTRFALRFPVRK